MSLRSKKERILQGVAFELGGIALVTPLYALAVGASSGHSMRLLVVLSVIVCLWSMIHNAVFDHAEYMATRRAASDRPHRLRLIHAASLELTSILLTCPAIILIGGHTLKEALLVNLGLTLSYMAYGYLFHILFDALRPVRSAAGALA